MVLKKRWDLRRPGSGRKYFGNKTGQASLEIATTGRSNGNSTVVRSDWKVMKDEDYFRRGNHTPWFFCGRYLLWVEKKENSRSGVGLFRDSRRCSRCIYHQPG